MLRFMFLVNAEIVHHHAASHATEGFRIRDPFTRRSGDGIAEVSLAAETETGHAGTVFDKQGGIQSSRHSGHVLDIM